MLTISQVCWIKIFLLIKRFEIPFQLPARSFNFLKGKKKTHTGSYHPFGNYSILFPHCPRFSPKTQFSFYYHQPQKQLISRSPVTAWLKGQIQVLNQKLPSHLKLPTPFFFSFGPEVTICMVLSCPSFPPHRCGTNSFPSESLASTKKPQTC